MSTYKVIILGQLPGANETIKANRTHWAVGAKQKKELTEYIEWLIRAQIKHHIGKAIYSFTWHEQNKRRDPDNIASAHKIFFDAMQAAGCIKNDGWNEVAELHDYFVVDPGNQKVEIVITELDPRYQR